MRDDQSTDDARNSVWIDWANSATQPTLSAVQPKAFINAPRGLNIERTPNDKRITLETAVDRFSCLNVSMNKRV